MGRYLAIGITIDLSFEKKKAAREFASLEAGVKYVEEHYAPLDLYDKAEDDEYVTYKLKDQFLENGLVDFLRDFYAAREPNGGQTKEPEIILAKLSEVHTAAEIMSLAREKCWERFQWDQYWDTITIYETKWGPVDVYQSGIDLSLDGKILMECYGGLFKFLSTVLQEKFSKHAIAKALRVTITG